MNCCGVQLRGKGRGLLCRNTARYTVRGSGYCHVHYVTAVKEPRRFREALAFMDRAEGRRLRVRREQEKQIDAFPYTTPGYDNDPAGQALRPPGVQPSSAHTGATDR